jgi:molecular chaperone GrpE
MKMNNTDKHQETEVQNDVTEVQSETNEQMNNENAADNAAVSTDEADNMTNQDAAFEKKFNDLNDTYLRLMAEYDNYRKRTLREKADLIKNGGESSLTALLPVIDDFDRALANIDSAADMKAVAEGVELIHGKFVKYLASQGVKEIEVKGKAFDAEISEAIAIIPAPSEDVKGQVLDCVQTGYTLHDKIIRHAKVVVAE